ncbi:hypothetical protein K0M31_004259, partial [Melipona bicolor]
PGIIAKLQRTRQQNVITSTLVETYVAPAISQINETHVRVAQIIVSPGVIHRDEESTLPQIRAVTALASCDGHPSGNRTRREPRRQWRSLSKVSDIGRPPVSAVQYLFHRAMHEPTSAISYQS